MTDSEPAYKRVLNDLRAQILSRQLAPGDRVPSIRVISERYSVTAGTAEQALRGLRSEGHIISRQGSGTYVREYLAIPRSSPSRLARERWMAGIPIQDAATGPRPRAVDVEVGEMPASRWVAEPLGLAEGTLVVFRARRFVVADRAVQLATSYLPTDVARGTAIMHTDTGPGGIYARLAEADHEPVGFTEHLRARMPVPAETERLRLVEGTQVIEITRHAFQADGRCVEINRMILDATAYELDYSFPAGSGA